MNIIILILVPFWACFNGKLVSKFDFKIFEPLVLNIGLEMADNSMTERISCTGKLAFSDKAIPSENELIIVPMTILTINFTLLPWPISPK